MNKTAGKGKLDARKSAGSKATHLPLASKPIIERPIVDASKFPNTQPKMAQMQKLTAGTSNVNITNSLVSGGSRTPSSDVSPSSGNVPQSDVVLRRKAPLRRPVSAVTCGRKAKERTVPIITEATKAVMLPSKRTDISNGRICYSSPAISHIIPAQLSITPVGTPITKIIQVTPPTRKIPIQRKYTCSQCKKPCPSPDKCDACRSPAVSAITHQLIPVVNSTEKLEQPTSTPPKVTCIPKELFYSANRIPVLPNIIVSDNYRVAGSRKVFVTPDQQGNPKGRPKGSKNRVIEPECLTISSDEEDRGDGSTSHSTEASSTVTASGRPRRGAPVLTFYDGRPTVTLKGNHVNPSNSNCIKTLADSSVTDERERNEVVEEDEDMEEEEEEEEEEDDHMNTSHEGMESDEETSFIKDGNPGKVTKGHLRLPCRSIRIGSFKIHPIDDLPYVSVYVTPECFHFEVSRTTKPSELVSITLKGPDIAQVLGHFGRCLPIIFIFTTPACAARIRYRLGMVKGGLMYYDPEVNDEKQKRITFLIDAMNDEIRNYLRNTFPGEGILKEIDQKAANEILVKSTPNQMNIGKGQTPAYQPPTPPSPVTPTSTLQNQPASQMPPVQPIQSVVQSLQPQGTVSLSITTLPAVQVKPAVIERPGSPVRKILTYPPAPQVGGITITNEDLACLDEGEFLNDAIIDFYLKYLINEKLSEADRKRTYIFSSYFYPRLTQKPTTRSAEDASGSMALKRHRQVKTWTKNLDLFEKDFIIIPINQNVHWFLAIICYPGLVSKFPNPSQPSPSSVSNKSSESDSPRNDQENDGSSNHCNNSLINTISPVKATLQTREQACETEDNSGSENSPHESCHSGYDESEQSFPEEPTSDLPDSTHPDGLPAPGQKTPCIVVFDSLAGPSRWRVANNLREYLEMEWKIKKGSHKVFDKTSIKAFVPRVPQQTNYSDCGIYVLQYVESFFENPFPYLASPLPDMTNWFTAEKVATKREELKSLIHKLEKRGSSSTSVTTNDSKTTSTRKNADSVSSVNSSQSSRMTPS